MEGSEREDDVKVDKAKTPFALLKPILYRQVRHKSKIKIESQYKFGIFGLIPPQPLVLIKDLGGLNKYPSPKMQKFFLLLLLFLKGVSSAPPPCVVDFQISVTVSTYLSIPQNEL